MRTKTRGTTSLGVRQNTQAEEKIEQCLVVSQQTETFASEEALQGYETIRLTQRDRDLFLAILDSDTHPNHVLQKAVETFKRHTVK